MLSSFVDVYLKFWYAAKPTIAAVHGWCVAGGTDLVLCTDLIVAGEGATFGYPPARVWGYRRRRCGCPGWVSSRPSATC
jgi:enoyl-CoA hydratase